MSARTHLSNIFEVKSLALLHANVFDPEIRFVYIFSYLPELHKPSSSIKRVLQHELTLSFDAS